MPVLKVYRNGVTMGRAPKKNDHERVKRGEVTGWSESAARRNLAFLRSIDANELTGAGYTVTLTLKNCPETAQHWARLRDSLFKRFARMGMIRGHWVTEWQRRGVPHLHGIFYFSESGKRNQIIDAWLELAAEYVVSEKAQHVREVTDIVGWFKYLAKHAARGHKHYQRDKSGIPDGWVKTGRVWGHVGEWPVDEVERWEVDERAYFRIRRIARGLAVSDARTPIPVLLNSSSGGKVDSGMRFVDGSRLRWARNMLKHNDRELSRLSGVSEWLPKERMNALIAWMLSVGYLVKPAGQSHLVTPDGLRFDPETGEVLDAPESAE